MSPPNAFASPPQPLVEAAPVVPQLTQAHVLRQRAETQFKHHAARASDNAEAPTPEATQKLLHELQVHQIELEMQNDELRQTHVALDSARARYFDLYDLAPVGYVTVSATGLILEANLTAAALLGVARSALVKRPLHTFVAKEDQDGFYLLRRQLWETGTPQSRELRMTHVDHHQLWVHLMATTCTDVTGATVLRVVLSDISALKSFERQLDHLAHYDPLTNLPNRLLKADRLHQAMAQARRSGRGLALVYIDLDGFKSINDKHGHDAGDLVLIAVADHMQQVLREGDTLARLGGDEFVAVLINLDDRSLSLPLLDRMLAAAAQPMPFEGQTLQVSASLGVTFYPQTQEVEGDQLLRQADQAMYQAKLAGKNRYHIFDAEQADNLRGFHESLHHIRLALAAHEFVLHYQPKVNLRTGQVVGVEALIRWQHPTQGLLAPSAFLPVIENHPLAVDVGDWVMATAVAQIETWQARGLHLPVSVNVGVRQLQQHDFAAQLRKLLAQHPRVNAADLTLEILETSALQDIAYMSQLIEDCRHMGIHFALDDFGTGYSSLTYLKRLRVALIKIDQSFVRDMLNDPHDQSILKGIMGLAEAFQCEVIAEGVETAEHGALLLQLGCELVQGAGIAQPMPAQDIPAWVAGWKPNMPVAKVVPA